MNKKSFLLSLLTTMLVAMLSLGFASCGDDEEDNTNPNNGQPVNPGTTVNDPEGTISLSMRNADNGKTKLDDIYIKNENFVGASFVSVGAVKGLGNVSTIPTAGWADQVSVIAGNGYVAYSNDQFYRIYVVGDIVATTGGIIGADIKYQEPFKGVDEAIQLPKTEVTLNADAGSSEEIIFKNKSIVLYSVSSDQSWCRVQKCSTNDYYFLYNGVYITCDENSSSSSREAIVSLKTVYDKEVIIKVTQTGKDPFITMSSASVEVTSREQTSSLSFVTNVDDSELQIEGATSWCKAEISTVNSARTAVKFIGNTPIQTTRASDGASQSYNLKLQFSENTNEDERVANIAIKSSKHNIQGVVKVVQKGVTFEVSQNLILLDRNNSYSTVIVTTTAHYWDAISSANWCTCTINGNQLTIRATSSTHEREATITFPNLKKTIIVKQSKYAVGDNYKEGNVEGTVGYIGTGERNDTIRIIYRLLETRAWSTENVSTGASSMDDGLYNMNVIRKIPNWKEIYPAFALCETLNIDGVTGWYIPSVNELKGKNFFSHDGWTSTEVDNSHAYHISHGGYGINKMSKSTNNKVGRAYSTCVYVFHRF